MATANKKKIKDHYTEVDDRTKRTYMIETAGHFYGPFKTANEAADYLFEEHLYGAPIFMLRKISPRKKTNV